MDSGWTEGLRDPSGLLLRWVACCGSVARAPRAALRGRAGLALSRPSSRSRCAWLIPVAVAGFVLSPAACGRAPRLRRRPRLRRGVLLRPHLLDARGRRPRLDRAVARWRPSSTALLGARPRSLQRHRLWPLWFAAAWTAIEVWRSGWPLGGMPWGRLAVRRRRHPGRRGAAVRRRGRRQLPARPARRAAGLAWSPAAVAGERGRRVAGARLVGLVRPARRPGAGAVDGRRPTASSPSASPSCRATCPATGDDILYDYRQVTQNHVDATIDLAERVERRRGRRGPTFVLWPENSTAVDPFDDAETNAGIRAASSAIGVPILVGAIVDGGPDQVLNQGIVWDPETGAGDRYTKWHPVPFGEYIPLRSVFTKYNFFDRLREVGRDMLSGTRREPLDIGGVKVADAICFDIAYDDGLYAQLAQRRRAAGGADQQARPSSTPTRSTSSSRSPGCARSRPAAGSRSPPPTASPGSSRPTATSSPPPTSAPGPCWSSRSALTDAAHPGDPDRTVGRAGSRRADGPGRHAGPAPVSSGPHRGRRRWRARRPRRSNPTTTGGA